MLDLICKSESGYYLIYEQRSKCSVRRMIENLVRAFSKNKFYCYRSSPVFKIYSTRKSKLLKGEYSSVEAAKNYIDRR